MKNNKNSQKQVNELVLHLKTPRMEDIDGKQRAMADAILIYNSSEKGKRSIESDPFVFHAPLGPIEKDDLKWYLERYHIWPAGLFKDRAKRTENDLPKWGRAIYDKAFPGGSAYDMLSAWENSRGEKRQFTVSIDSRLVEGTGRKEKLEANEAASGLLSLPWELMHDGRSYLFREEKPVQVRRQLPTTKVFEASVSEPPIRILLVSPRPDDGSVSYIDHRMSALPLVEAVENLGGLVELTVLTPATFPALKTELNNAKQKGTPYHVVHFDGHGGFFKNSGSGGLCFEDPVDSVKLSGRRKKLIDARWLGSMIKEDRIPLFFLEACQSAVTERDPTASVAGALLNEGAASVVAMSYTVLVETTRRFVEAFYKELAGGASIGEAMLAGHSELHSDPKRLKIFGAGQLELYDWFVPVLYQEKEDIALFKGMSSPISIKESKAKREASYGALPPEPDHRFTGRSRELLAMERLLEQKKYMAIGGQGGEGKTTIAAELGRWLVRTRRFEQVVFVCVEDIYDVRTVVDRIGHQLVDKYSVAQFPDDELMTQALVPIEEELRKRKTLLILDNMESILPPPRKRGDDLTAYAVQLEQEELELFFTLCEKLNNVGDTRLVFTSREPIPSPFNGKENHIELGRLNQTDAIKLVTDVMTNEGIFPKEEEPGGTPPNIEALVEAVNCHARSLVLMAPYVGEMGVNETKENLEQLMIELHRKHPDDRERSVFACVEMSLRRLSPWVREAIKPLAVFHGGGNISSIQNVLGVDEEKQKEIVDELRQTRLIEVVDYIYLRFHPALSPYLQREITESKQTQYMARWVEDMIKMNSFLYDQLFENAHLSAILTHLELPNLVYLLEYTYKQGNPEKTVKIASALEQLISRLGRKHLRSEVSAIRETESGKINGWSQIRFESKRSEIERIIESGNIQKALDEAQALLEQCQKAGENAYKEASYNIALTIKLIGKLLNMKGEIEAALSYTDEAYHRFQVLAEQGHNSASRMAAASLTEKGDCLLLLGRLKESVEAYQKGISIDVKNEDYRGIAVGNVQLGTVRMYQKKLDEAKTAYLEALKIFSALGEPTSLAIIWNQIGMVYAAAGNWAEAEDAYCQSLSIKVQQHNMAGEASTLMQLGNLYEKQNRLEEAVVFKRQALEKYIEIHSPADEGFARNNLSNVLIRLEKFDEARQEILRAIECLKPFGHFTKFWTAYMNLSCLEKLVGNESAALKAREKAFQLFLSFRRAGGENHEPGGKVCAKVSQLLQSVPPEEIGKILEEQTANIEAGAPYKLFLSKLLSILAGARDRALVNDPNLDYDDAVELVLLMERLDAGA